MKALEALIAGELAQPVPPGAHALAELLREIFGPSLRAVLMYGSNLRLGNDREGVLDLYALVASYRSAYRSRALAIANRLLPPNVFYLETTVGSHVVRCKYAVLAVDDLPRLASPATSEPYFWARFSQPCALVYAADEHARDTVVTALAGAIVAFLRFGVPLATVPFDGRALWTGTWQATYAAEIRPERSDAAGAIYASSAERFEQATALALPYLPWPTIREIVGDRRCYRADVPAPERRRAARAWWLRRRRAKVLFLLRILRNGFIFEGGIDYILWKIQRHSGVGIDQTWRQKRHRWLALGAEVWRLYRVRAFR
jgi:hypothetical protein